jgi:hypothetical protein
LTVKVLFDNTVPAPLRRHLAAHEVTTAREMGWHELENGDLLAAAEQGDFDALLTAEGNLSYSAGSPGPEPGARSPRYEQLEHHPGSAGIGGPRRRCCHLSISDFGTVKMFRLEH